MIRILKALAKAFAPQRCAYCDDVIFPQDLMCEECAASLPRIEGEICVRCGREKDECSCDGEKYYSILAAPFYYEGVVRKGLHIFKFRHGQQNSGAYCLEMAETFSERFAAEDFDYIVGVPMTKKSIRKRGYNQVRLLAKGLSECVNIPYREDVLIKLYETRPQHGISYLFRKGNLTGVFDVGNPDAVRGKKILLCDDISTSGETFNECAKILWLNGAEKVCCICLALTKSKKKDK